MKVDESFWRKFQANKDAAILYSARNTTPAQRLQWIEDMLLLLHRNGYDVHNDKIKAELEKR